MHFAMNINYTSTNICKIDLNYYTKKKGCIYDVSNTHVCITKIYFVCNTLVIMCKG